MTGDIESASYCLRLSDPLAWRNVAILAMKLWIAPDSLTSREWLIALYVMHWSFDKAVFAGELLLRGEADVWSEITGTIDNWLNATEGESE